MVLVTLYLDKYGLVLGGTMVNNLIIFSQNNIRILI